MSSKSEALAALDDGYRRFRAGIADLDDAAYAETWLGTWNLSQLLAHMAGWYREMTDALERVAEITKVTQRMLDTVTQLLSLERIESTIRGTGELFCPLDLIQDVMAGLAPLVARKGHTVTIHLPETRPRVRGAPALLREAFLNLVDNAIQYTPDGGQIDVHASVD
ncbi:MAG: hypothetical protein WHT63_03100, partial [Tepidiforma sp.]